MKFQLAVNLERMDASLDMREVARHTLEMVQMAEDGGFNIAWAAEHHALEMTIAPDPFQILTWWGAHTSKIRLGTAVAVPGNVRAGASGARRSGTRRRPCTARRAGARTTSRTAATSSGASSLPSSGRSRL